MHFLPPSPAKEVLVCSKTSCLDINAEHLGNVQYTFSVTGIEDSLIRSIIMSASSGDNNFLQVSVFTSHLQSLWGHCATIPLCNCTFTWCFIQDKQYLWWQVPIENIRAIGLSSKQIKQVSFTLMALQVAAGEVLWEAIVSNCKFRSKLNATTKHKLQYAKVLSKRVTSLTNAAISLLPGSVLMTCW